MGEQSMPTTRVLQQAQVPPRTARMGGQISLCLSREFYLLSTYKAGNLVLSNNDALPLYVAGEYAPIEDSKRESKRQSDNPGEKHKRRYTRILRT